VVVSWFGVMVRCVAVCLSWLRGGQRPGWGQQGSQGEREEGEQAARAYFSVKTWLVAVAPLVEVARNTSCVPAGTLTLLAYVPQVSLGSAV
jgi:hypothetical protein